MSWTTEVVLEFVDLYRGEPILWDPKHPLHRNRTEINEAWDRIRSALSINCTVVDLKKKKESLMTSFRMHWNRKKRCPDTYHTTWFAYALMESFLGEKYECDSTNQIENELYTTSTYTHIQQPNEQSNIRNLSTPDRNNSVQRHNVRSSHASSTNSKADNKPYIMVCNKGLTEESSYGKDSAIEKQDIDEYELFGQLLAKKLRKLDEHERDVAMHEIDNIMFRAKMRSGSMQQRSYSSTPSPVPRKIKSPIFIVAPPNNSQYEDENISYQDPMQTHNS